MPLIARIKKTQETVCILDIPNPSSKFVKGEIICPYCDANMTVVTSSVRVNHFRHLPGPPCTDPYQSAHEGETIFHIVGKAELYKQLQTIYPKTKGYKIDVEYPLKQVGRRADVYVYDPNGWNRAYEIQLSYISHMEFEERTRSYESAGVNICWILGGKANVKENIDWSLERFGKVYQMEFKKELIKLPFDEAESK